MQTDGRMVILVGATVFVAYVVVRETIAHYTRKWWKAGCVTVVDFFDKQNVDPRPWYVNLNMWLSRRGL